MPPQADTLLFGLTLTDEQRMNRETMQRFAAAEMRERASAPGSPRGAVKNGANLLAVSAGPDPRDAGG